MVGEGEAVIAVGSAVSRRFGVRVGVARVVGLEVLVREGVMVGVSVRVAVAVAGGSAGAVSIATWVARGGVGVGR